MRRMAAIVLLAGPAMAAEPEIAWESGLARAQQAARAAHKPILVDVWATWCAPCKLMDKTTYRDEEVLSILPAFVPVKLDADANEAFLERFRVEAFPTVLVLDEDGREIGRRRGYVSAKDLGALMRDAAGGYSSYRGARTRKDDAVAMHTVGIYLARVGNPEAVGWLKKAANKANDPALKQAVQETLDGFVSSATAAQRP
ncbi:MAG TPA: thioredoxin family protein [Candidatus Polarisedimenticolaceae bacterium]